jgi:hypothetical protein
MQNVQFEVKGDLLVVTVDLSKQVGPSKSGKTIIIGTTAGNQSVTPDGAIKIGVNVYKYQNPKGGS